MADTIKGIKVSLQSASAGAGKASIGLKIDRGHIELEVFDSFFVAARLDVTIDPSPDPDQQYIKGLEPEPVTAIAETGTGGIGADAYATRLTFGKEEAAGLCRIAGQCGTIKATRLGDAVGAE